MNIILSTIIALIIAIITIGIHYLIPPKHVFSIVDNSEVTIKKRRNLKYKMALNSLSPSTTSLIVPSTGVIPIEFVSITNDPKLEKPSIPSDSSTGINGINKFYLYNCNSDDVVSIRGFNMLISNATVTNLPTKIKPVKSNIGSPNEPGSYVPYDPTKPLILNPGYQISVESDKSIVLNRAVTIYDNPIPLSIYAYIIDVNGNFRGLRFDNIKNDIFVIDLYNK